MKAKGIEYLQFSPKILTSSPNTDRLPVRSQYREHHKLVLNLRSQEAKRDVISSELARSLARCRKFHCWIGNDDVVKRKGFSSSKKKSGSCRTEKAQCFEPEK